MMRFLGLDLGERRLGVALSDPEGILAFPLAVIPSQGVEKDLEAILGLVAQHGVGEVVVGWPRSLDGSRGSEAGKAEAFQKLLSERTPIPVQLHDERLSTAEAERALLETGMKRAQRREKRDAVAAALILQGYLDHRRAMRAAPETTPTDTV